MSAPTLPHEAPLQPLPTRRARSGATAPGDQRAAPITRPLSAHEAPPARPSSRRTDLRHLLIVLAGFVLVLLILPPQHEHPIIDDWIYAGSVRNMLDAHTFIMPLQSQANLVGLTLWGALWCSVFGYSFTVLTYSTLFMSLAALFSFYGLVRALGAPPGGALFGTGLLGFNPLFLHLSYTFMTDVPFLALVLSSSLLYVLGLRPGRLVWLLTIPAGLLAGWAFLIRQFGLLVPAGFLAYLLLDALVNGGWARRLGQAALVLIPPAIIAGIWFYLMRNIPSTFAQNQANGIAATFVLKEPWLRVFLLRSLTILPLAALFAWGAWRIRRAHRWLVPALALLVVLGLFTLDRPEEQWLPNPYPPASAQAGPFTITLSQEMYTFENWGNIIRRGGIDFFEYGQEPLWTPEVWRVIWVVGLAMGVLLLASIASALSDRARIMVARRGPRVRSPLHPSFALYLVGFLTFATSTALAGYLFDRYILAYLPFLLIFLVRGSAHWGQKAWAFGMGGLAVLATFTLLARADFNDHNDARWQAGEWVRARTGAVHVGYDYNNWSRFSSDIYRVDDLVPPDHRIEKRFPYFSRLGGFTTRYVYAHTRADLPPLPVLPGDTGPSDAP